MTALIFTFSLEYFYFSLRVVGMCVCRNWECLCFIPNLKAKGDIWVNVDENEIWSELQESHTSDFTVSQACCIECLTKNPVFLPSCMSPQRRRRLSKFGNRIRKSFRAAKRWKSSLRLGRRSSTFRVRKLIGQYFDWSYALTMNCFVCLRPVLTLSPHSSVEYGTQYCNLNRRL